jgi:V8-like Glu-specific endopeptidase
VHSDTSKSFDNTGWYYGDILGKDLLAQTPPQKTFENSGFTYFTPAKNYFNVSNYPARTAVKIFLVQNDSLKQKCSGVMVAKNYVLTDCHCIGSFGKDMRIEFYDSLLFVPAYDNGSENSLFKKSFGASYITFKEHITYSWNPDKDIALVKLEQDLGTKTGWVGIAYSEDESFYKKNVFHKFSYPGKTALNDTTKKFNGDTLYYNYGTLDMIEKYWLMYKILGVPGQSGSSLFYTNNNAYYSVGTMVYADNSRHLKITPEMFYVFKPILEDEFSSIANSKVLPESYFLYDAYPNPFNSSTIISFTIPKSEYVTLKIFDLLGREVETLVDELKQPGNYKMSFNTNRPFNKILSSGVYYYHLRAGNFSKTKKLVLLK